MLLNKPQHFPRFPIAKWALCLSHLPRNSRLRAILLQELLYRQVARPECRSGVCGIEDLKAELVLFDAQVANLAEISSVDIAPGVAFSRHRLPQIFREVALVFMWFDDVPDAQGVDVVLEAAGECLVAVSVNIVSEMGKTVVTDPRSLLATDLRKSVAVHWVDVVVFFQGI